MKPPPITRDELAELLAELLPDVPARKLAAAAVALHLVLKAGKLAEAAAPAKRPRQYREKSVADSLHMKPR